MQFIIFWLLSGIIAAILNFFIKQQSINNLTIGNAFELIYLSLLGPCSLLSVGLVSLIFADFWDKPLFNKKKYKKRNKHE